MPLPERTYQFFVITNAGFARNVENEMNNEKLLDRLKWYQANAFASPDPILAETISELESLYNTIDILNRLVTELEKELHYG